MKACFKCGEEKPLAEYYAHKQMADGHLNKCKSCTKSDVKHNRDLNIEHYRAYDRARGSRQPPEYQREQRRKHPEKFRARRFVSRKLTSPGVCSLCGSTHRIEAHHHDYSKPLEVEWLCSACHKQVHFRAG